MEAWKKFSIYNFYTLLIEVRNKWQSDIWDLVKTKHFHISGQFPMFCLSAIFGVITAVPRPCSWELGKWFFLHKLVLLVSASVTHLNRKSHFFLLHMSLNGGGHILSELVVLISRWSDELIFKQTSLINVLMKHLEYQIVFSRFTWVLCVFSLYLVELYEVADIWPQVEISDGAT